MLAEQGQHLLLNYFKTLSVGLSGNRTRASHTADWHLTNWANQAVVVHYQAKFIFVICYVQLFCDMLLTLKVACGLLSSCTFFVICVSDNWLEIQSIEVQVVMSTNKISLSKTMWLIDVYGGWGAIIVWRLLFNSGGALCWWKRVIWSCRVGFRVGLGLGLRKVERKRKKGRN